MAHEAAERELLVAIELHSVERMRQALDGGFDVRAPLRGKPVVDRLIEMYTRTDRFPDCLRLLLERGAVLADPALAPVLLDDAEALRSAIRTDPSLLEHRTDLISAFTPLTGASLLHVAAEYGHLRAARLLVELGADLEARAAVDEHGMNGHTPLFHTVNSNDNRTEPLLRLLLDAGAACDVRLAGITWGRGFDWETTCFDVTPVSYAQCGLLPQFHRREREVYANVQRLLEAAGRRVPALPNVPNRYLQSSVDAASGRVGRAGRVAARRDGDPQRDPEATLRAYVKAFESLDQEAFVPFYALPCTFVGPAGASVVADAAAARAVARVLVEHARSQDYRRTGIVALESERLSDHLASLSGTFVRFDSKDVEIGRFGFRYLMQRGGDGWSIVVAVAHDPS